MRAIKGRLTRQTVKTASGWEVSFDCDEEVTLSPAELVKDARAVVEGRPARWNAEGSKIRVFAVTEPDGRVKIELYARPDDVPKEILEDVARLLELLAHLQPDKIYSTEAQDRLRRLLRERFPTLPQYDQNRLQEAALEVLREPATWQEDMPPEERAPYLATAAYHALNKQPVHDGPDRDFETEPPLVDVETEDSGPSAEVSLYQREMDAKARALDLRDGERQILELVLSGRADGWKQACDMVGLPPSYRANLLKKLRKLSG